MEEEKKESNAKRFIDAYNQIDYGLRVIHDFKRSMSFSDMIRRAVAVNQIVRKFEDDLIDYGRLRNAIIHRSNEEFVIAEPHDEVVDKICKIAKLITTPPKALDTVCRKDVLSVDGKTNIRRVIELISKSSYSNIPVYDNGELKGVANGQKIIDALGREISKNTDISNFIEKTSIEEVLLEPENCPYYVVASSDVTVEDVLDMFETNRKLLVVLITKSGTMHEPPLGIITSSNVMEMNLILDNY